MSCQAASIRDCDRAGALVELQLVVGLQLPCCSIGAQLSWQGIHACRGWGFAQCGLRWGQMSCAAAASRAELGQAAALYGMGL